MEPVGLDIEHQRHLARLAELLRERIGDEVGVIHAEGQTLQASGDGERVVRGCEGHRRGVKLYAVILLDDDLAADRVVDRCRYDEFGRPDGRVAGAVALVGALVDRLQFDGAADLDPVVPGVPFARGESGDLALLLDDDLVLRGDTLFQIPYALFHLRESILDRVVGHGRCMPRKHRERSHARACQTHELHRSFPLLQVISCCQLRPAASWPRAEG